MPETRTMIEGNVRWVQASGNGSAWVTASAAPTGLLGFVTNMQWGIRQQEHIAIMNRGQFSHWKAGDKGVLAGSFDLIYGITAEYPPTAVTAGGASLPIIHLEHKMLASEVGATSGVYHIFAGVVIDSVQITEGKPNSMTFNFQAATVIGPTASGYLG